MMLFKLSLKNIRKSFKDYAIYFLTLILGVAIFYVFNAIDSQQAMLEVSNSTRGIMKLMVSMLSGVSVVVALILGFLIIYANNFLIKRRKKEFAVYMMLGMGKQEVSQILFGETILIGLFSLCVGLVIGVFASQFMSILVAKMFEADMTAFAFTFSKNALIKTIIYFGIMYLIVILFNVFMLTKYQLIDLLQAKHKTEQTKLKNSYLAVVVFLVAVLVLGYAYYCVTVDCIHMTEKRCLFVIGLGCISTYFIFWSLAGFLLKLLQRFKKIYLNGLNAFVFRQLNSNITTSVFSMTIICLLFFVTICVLSAGLSVNDSLRRELKRLSPVDINLTKVMDIEGEDYSEEELEHSALSIEESLAKIGGSTDLLKDVLEVTTYTCDDFTVETTLGTVKEELMEVLPYICFEEKETIISISDYNRVAEKYGLSPLQIEKGKYIELCNFNQIKKFRNRVLKEGVTIKLGNFVLQPQFEECQNRYILISNVESNMGITVVPDEVIEQELGKSVNRAMNVLIADYNAESKQGKRKIEDLLINSEITEKFSGNGFYIDWTTKISISESSIGLAAIATFIALYLGIVFLIAGAALLALKELSESADNQERYQILNKIGADRKMQNKALLCQMGIFFGMPMLLAIIHSVFGIQFAQNMLSVMFRKEDMIIPILVTAIVLIVIYGVYFLATYLGSKRIIEE